MKALPKEVLVAWEGWGGDGLYLDVHEHPAEFAEVGKTIHAGKYRFVSAVEITAKTTIVTVAK